jgi:hypothetical protein
MELANVKERSAFMSSKRTKCRFNEFHKLILELGKRELPEKVINTINDHLEVVNSVSSSEKQWSKELLRKKSTILALLEKELKLVTRNYYRDRWIAIGMAAFGIPLGVAMGTSLGNMAFIGTGIPIGLAIGAGVGAGMDKKAFDEGRRLDLD